MEILMTTAISVVQSILQNIPTNLASDSSHRSDRSLGKAVAKPSTGLDENVTVRAGFEIVSPIIAEKYDPESGLDRKLFRPRLAHGETAQGFMTVTYVPGHVEVDHYKQAQLSLEQIQQLIAKGALNLNEGLSADVIEVLINNGLQSRFPASCNLWKEQKKTLRKARHAAIERDERRLFQQLSERFTEIEAMMCEVVADRLLQLFPTITRTELHHPALGDNTTRNKALDRLSQLQAVHPRLEGALKGAMRHVQLDHIASIPFQQLKNRIIVADRLIDEHRHKDSTNRWLLIDAILCDDRKSTQKALRDLRLISKSKGKSPVTRAWHRMTASDSAEQALITEAEVIASVTTDAHFLHSVENMTKLEPGLRFAGNDAIALARDHFCSVISNVANILARKAELILQDDVRGQLRGNADIREDQFLTVLRTKFICDIYAASQAQSSIATLILVDFQAEASTYQVTARRESHIDPALEYKIHMLDLTVDQREMLQLDPSFIPVPQVDDVPYLTFRLPPDHKILHVQLLQKDGILLVVDDCRHSISIFFDSHHTMADTISRAAFKSQILREQSFSDVVVAFDESKRILAICAKAKLLPQFLLFDHDFQLLEIVEGTSPFYDRECTPIHNMCFVGDADDLLVVDTDACMKLFSWRTSTFCPSVIRLSHLPTKVHCVPKSSFFLVLSDTGSGMSLQAYDSNTFSDTEGILLDYAVSPTDDLAVTLFVNEDNIHILSLDVAAQKCRSIALNIVGRAPATFQCCVCLEEHLKDDLAYVEPCQHAFCRESLRTYVGSKLNERRFPISCPGCIADPAWREIATVITETMVQLIGISEEQYQIWVELEMVPFSVQLHCRMCGNSMFVDRQDYNYDTILTCPMPACNHQWCKMCQQDAPNEGEHSCDGSKELDALVKNNNWKRCPGCQALIQKTTGCNHMTCTVPGCNTEFCYVCGKAGPPYC